MPEVIQLFRVFVAAPSDVIVERGLIGDLLTEWNIQHGARCRARVELISWHTHTHPAAGKRPQALINKQAFDACDIVTAVFLERFGSPTGADESGTVEEIKRGIRMKKSVMVYFSDNPAPRKRGGASQLEKIAAFKKKLGQRALYHTFSDPASFQKAYRQHLAQTMNELLERNSLGVR